MRATILMMTGCAILLACVRVAPEIGQLAAMIVGGVLGYYVAKPSGSVFAAWACGSIGGAILGTLAGIAVVSIRLPAEREAFVSDLGLARYYEWAWREGIAVVGLVGIAGGTAFGGLVAGGGAWVTNWVKEPPPNVPGGSPMTALRAYLYGQVLATVYVAALAYADFYRLGFPQGFLAQAVCLALLLLSLGFGGAPLAIILTGIRYRIPVVRWAPMVVAGFVLLLIQLAWFLFLF